MKKKFGLIFLVMLAMVSLFALGACDKLELANPSNVQYDGKTITWNAVENADHYTVQIDDGQVYEVTQPKYPYKAVNTSFTVRVTAISKASKVVSSGETVITFYDLGQVTDIVVDDMGNLSWSVIPDATGYLIRINGEDKEVVATPSYSNLGEGRNDVQVKAVVDGNSSYYALWSPVTTVNILGTVAKDSIVYEDGAVSWGYVPNALGYEVKINGQVVAENTTRTSYTYDAQNKNFEVVVKALGNKASYYDGKESEVKKFVYLATITNIQVEDGIIHWEEIAGATGYRVRLNNVLQSQVLTKTELHVAENVSYDVEIMPISDDSTYFSSWSSVKNVLILPAPVIAWNSDLELDGEANNNVYWDSVASAAGYAVRLTKPNGEVIVQNFGATQRNFGESYLDVGEYKVEVKSLATPSSTVFDSVYSQPIYVNRLSAPKAVAENFITSNPSNVSEGFTVTFQSISGATYRLFLDKNEIQSGSRTQFTVGNLIDKSITAEQEFNYSIQSVGNVSPDGKRINLSSLTENSLSFKITVLATPSNADISGYTYSWGEVQKASGYVVSNGSSGNTSLETQYDLSGLTAGNHELSVCSRGNGREVLPSNYTSAISVVRLEAPTNVKIDTTDAAEGQLTFNGVEHAQGYEIVYNNSNNPLPIETQSNINSMISTEGTTIYLQTKANYFNNDKTIYYMSSQPGKSYNFVKFVAPAELKFSNTQLFWNPPANINTSIYAPTYEVYYADGTTYNGEKNGTSMDISYLKGGQEYTFLVKAIGNGSSYINSEKSQPATIYKLATPVVTRSNKEGVGVYTWTSVASATGYVVYVDGVVAQRYTHEAGKTYEFVPKFTELKTYKVEIQAIGDNALTVIDSDKAVIEQEIKQLATPDFSIGYSALAYDEHATIDVTITKETPDASGYSYSFDGVENISAEKTFSYNPNGTGTIKVRVYAVGGGFDANNVYCLASQSVGGTTNYSITLLPTINKDNLTLSGEGVLTWTAVSGATGYNVEVLHNGEVVQTERVTSARIQFTGFEKSGTWTVRISCDGNDSSIIDSKVTEVEWTF